MSKEKRKGTKEIRKPKQVKEKNIAAAPSLKGGTTPASKPAKAK